MISIKNQLAVQLIFCPIIYMTIKTSNEGVVNTQRDLRTLSTNMKRTLSHMKLVLHSPRGNEV